MEITTKFSIGDKVWFYTYENCPTFREGIITDIIFWNKTNGCGYEIHHTSTDGIESVNEISEDHIFFTKNECLDYVKFYENLTISEGEQISEE